MQPCYLWWRKICLQRQHSQWARSDQLVCSERSQDLFSLCAELFRRIFYFECLYWECWQGLHGLLPLPEQLLLGYLWAPIFAGDEAEAPASIAWIAAYNWVFCFRIHVDFTWLIPLTPRHIRKRRRKKDTFCFLHWQTWAGDCSQWWSKSSFVCGPMSWGCPSVPAFRTEGCHQWFQGVQWVW